MKKVFTAALLVILVSACKSKSGFRYSQEIVKLERSLKPDIEFTESKVKEFADGEQYDSIAAVSLRMEKIVEEKRAAIEKMPVPGAKGAGEFRSSILRYFDYIKSLYKSYKDFGLANTNEEREKVAAHIQDIVADKDEVLSDVRKAQEKYARDNGFKVE